MEIFSIAIVHFKELPEAVSNRWYKSMGLGLMASYQIFCSQSFSQSITNTPKRIIFFSCFTIDLIITSAYGGGLATILTLPSYSEVADTMTKMVDLGIDWGAVSDAWIYSVDNSEDVGV